MRHRVVGLAAACLLALSGQAWAQELLPASPSGWSPFGSRVVPRTVASQTSEGYSLGIEGSGIVDVYGGWRTVVTGVAGGRHYRFTARALPVNVTSLRESVSVIIRWRGSFGDEVAPDYIWNFRRNTDGTLLFDRTLQAPSGSSSLEVQLILQWVPTGEVAFDRMSLTQTTAPSPRRARVAAVYYRPSGTSSGTASVQAAASYAAQVAGSYRPDVMVLGEQLNVIGAPGSLEGKAEPIPGPSTAIMANVAQGYSTNIVFGMLERSPDNRLYNTAVLIDRRGTIAGVYRKVQIPSVEAAAGIAPGDHVPVFDTDIGRVAMLICQDAMFTEPAREAAVQGAEMLLVPIWGGKPALLAARAAENGVYVAASGYDYASEVLNPLGSVLARVKMGSGGRVAIADLDLTQRFREPWTGEWRDVVNKERRQSPYRIPVP